MPDKFKVELIGPSCHTNPHKITEIKQREIGYILDGRPPFRGRLNTKGNWGLLSCYWYCYSYCQPLTTVFPLRHWPPVAPSLMEAPLGEYPTGLINYANTPYQTYIGYTRIFSWVRADGDRSQVLSPHFGNRAGNERVSQLNYWF